MTNRKIRVLQLIDTFTVGGAETLVLSLAKHMDDERFQVIPCALFGSGPLEEEMKEEAIPYRILGLPRRSILSGSGFVIDVWRMVTALRKTLSELSIDILHTHLTYTTLVGALATSQKKSPPLCATVHSIIFDNRRSQLSPRTWLMRAGIKAVFPRACRIIAVSDRVADAVQSYTSIARDRITTIANGVDGQRFLVKQPQSDLRRKLELPLHRSVVIAIGRLTAAKGYPYLLAALALIPAQERPLTLIVGDGPERGSLEHEISMMKLNRDVRFLGNRKDIPDLLAASDVFLLPSLWEGLPLALLESMASGLPAIVTEVGENPEVLEYGKCGVLVPPGDSHAIADSLVRLLREPDMRMELGKNARDRFSARYGLQRLIAEHEALYEDMLISRRETTREQAQNCTAAFNGLEK